MPRDEYGGSDSGGWDTNDGSGVGALEQGSGPSHPMEHD